MREYEVNGEKLRLIDNNLDLLNKGIPLLVKMRKLTHEYTKDIDLSLLDMYAERIREYNFAVKSIEDTLENEELTEDKKTEYRKKIDEYKEKLSQTENDLKLDAGAQSLIKLRDEIESYALIEVMTDKDLLKPVFGKILTGDTSKIDFTDLSFVRDVVTDFFTATASRSLQLS